jgi:hypothetical protein
MHKSRELNIYGTLWNWIGFGGIIHQLQAPPTVQPNSSKYLDQKYV